MNPCKRIHDVCKSHLYLDVDQGKEKCENKKNKKFFYKRDFVFYISEIWEDFTMHY
jgi:hypothetical protein